MADQPQQTDFDNQFYTMLDPNYEVTPDAETIQNRVLIGEELKKAEADLRLEQQEAANEIAEFEAQRQFGGNAPTAEGWDGDLTTAQTPEMPKVFTVSSYTGTDVKAYIVLPRMPGQSNISSSKVLRLGTLRALSYSVFREKQPVRGLGHVYPKAFTKGTRTIAGTMIFSVLLNDVFDQIRNVYAKTMENSEVAQSEFPYVLNDQLPPFDLFLQFQNEMGFASHAILYGVELFTDGMSISVDNLIIEEQIRYQARGFTGLEWDGREAVETFKTDLEVKVTNNQNAYNFFRDVLTSSSTFTYDNDTQDYRIGEYASKFEQLRRERMPFS